MAQPPEEFDIRYSTPEDLAFLQTYFSDPKAREPFPFDTDRETEESLKNWITFSNLNCSLTGMISNIPCALATLFLMPYKKVAHHASFYLMIDPEQRKKGIGTSMLRNLLHLAKTRFRLESVHIEFYEPNEPLRALLDKFAFHEFARQENFYHLHSASRPRVLMEHKLG